MQSPETSALLSALAMDPIQALDNAMQQTLPDATKKAFERSCANPMASDRLVDDPDEVLTNVERSIRMSFPGAMDRVQWDGLLGCFTFWFEGVFYGVETDGHIHS